MNIFPSLLIFQVLIGINRASIAKDRFLYQCITPLTKLMKVKSVSNEQLSFYRPLPRNWELKFRRNVTREWSDLYAGTFSHDKDLFITESLIRKMSSIAHFTGFLFLHENCFLSPFMTRQTSWRFKFEHLLLTISRDYPSVTWSMVISIKFRIQRPILVKTQESTKCSCWSEPANLKTSSKNKWSSLSGFPYTHIPYFLLLRHRYPDIKIWHYPCLS